MHLLALQRTFLDDTLFAFFGVPYTIVIWIWNPEVIPVGVGYSIPVAQV